MGYTHYFTQLENLSEEEFTKIGLGISELVKNTSATTDLKISNSAITLDDCKNYGESLYISKDKIIPTSTFIPEGFNFCKTGHVEYDEIVTATLLLLHDIVPKKYSIASDGNYDEDWKPAQDLFTKTFGHQPVAPF